MLLTAQLRSLLLGIKAFYTFWDLQEWFFLNFFFSFFLQVIKWIGEDRDFIICLLKNDLKVKLEVKSLESEFFNNFHILLFPVSLYA